MTINREYNPKARTQCVRNALTAAFISIALMGICSLGGNFQTDPGHKEEVTIGSIKFSCPKGFTVQTPSGFATTRLLRNDKHGVGVFVMLPDKDVNDALIEEVANAMTLAFLKESATYKWKSDGAYARVSKFEISGGGLVGFDGKKLVCFQYRLLTIKEKEILVGEIFKLSRGEEAKRAFENGLGGMSIDGASGESHVIASLTGETYSDIMGVPGGMTGTPQPAQRKN
jgi:hypothetical protein